MTVLTLTSNRKPTHNCLPQLVTTWLIEALCFYLSSVLVDSLVHLINHQQEAAKRLRTYYFSITLITDTYIYLKHKFT